MKKQKEKGKKASEKLESKKETFKPASEENGPDSTARKKEDDVPGTTAEAPEKSIEDTVDSSDTIQEPASPSKRHGRQPSLSIQSKMRSDSFRRASGPVPLSPSPSGAKGQNLPALSPDGDAVTEIYRKQALRLEELEKENKRLTKEAEASETRWRKSEEELEEIRESNLQVAELKNRVQKADAKVEELNRLVSRQSLCVR